jgi:predicted RNA-binding protein with PIN domain
VAAEGERAVPKVPAPVTLVPLMRHRRLSAASYATIRDAIDTDGIFRARVAERATADEVGRAGWLWLHRPVGWAEDPAFDGATLAPARTGRTRDGDTTALLREKLAAAEADRKEAAGRAAALRRENAELRTSYEALRAEASELVEQRREAVRDAKAAQAELARARADLKVRKQALVDLEQELAAARASATAPASPAPARPATPARSSASSPARRRSRPLPELSPGVFDGTPEAHRSLIASSANRLVVDGYNLARAAWSGLAPEEERRRTVRLLESVQARSGGSVSVVFDGQDDERAPRASRAIRVYFSASGQTADELIGDLVAAAPADVPVVVVSSDRAVQREASALGASVMASADLLAAVT